MAVGSERFAGGWLSAKRGRRPALLSMSMSHTLLGNESDYRGPTLTVYADVPEGPTLIHVW